MMLAQAFFALMNVCTRLGARELPWAEIAAVRFLVGAILAAGLAWTRGTSLRVTDRRGTWWRTLFGTLAAVASFYSLASPRIHVGDAAVLNATAPIFVALLSGRLLDERVGAHVSLAVAIAFLGVMAVVRPSFAAAAPIAVLATAGSFCYALAMIWLRRIGPGESHEAVVLHFSLFAFGLMVLLAAPGWRWPEAHALWYLLGAGLGGGGAQMAMTRAYALRRAAPVTALSYLGVILTYLAAIPVFGERPTAWQLAGSALVIVAGVLVTARGRVGTAAPGRL